MITICLGITHVILFGRNERFVPIELMAIAVIADAMLAGKIIDHFL